MDLYVLAERRGIVQEVPSGLSNEIVELFLVEHPACGQVTGLFLSPVDAELCAQYLNRQAHEGLRNRYEIRRHTDPAVQHNVRHLGETLGALASLVIGFTTDAAHQLVVKGGCYSLAHLPLRGADMNWLFGAGPQPRQDVLKSAFEILAEHGADDHAGELESMARLEADAIEKIAAIALRQIGARTAGTPVGLSIYSPSRQGWRHLHQKR